MAGLYILFHKLGAQLAQIRSKPGYMETELCFTSDKAQQLHSDNSNPKALNPAASGKIKSGDGAGREPRQLFARAGKNTGALTYRLARLCTAVLAWN